MNRIKRLALLPLAGLLVASGYASAESLTQIRLVDPLDEPEFYCLDLAGWGDHLRLDDPLQAHTCKARRAGDQMFAFKEGKIVVGDTGRCLEVAGSGSPPLPGAAVIARECKDNPLQAFTLEDNGRIVSTGSDLCLAAGEDSADASGPSHVWRVLTAQKCDAVSAELTTWQVGL